MNDPDLKVMDLVLLGLCLVVLFGTSAYYIAQVVR